MGFRDTKDVNVLTKYLVKLDNDKSLLFRVVGDVLEQWRECWPTFLGDEGKRIMRRFVSDADATNFKPIFDYKKSHDIKAMFAGMQDRDLKMNINNWNTNNQNAVIIVVGIEQMENGKRVVQWNKSCKILQFGSTVLSQFKAINRNPTNIERCTSNDKLPKMIKDFKMGDPDMPGSGGYLCTDMFAFKITKTKQGGRVNFLTEVDKLMGPMAPDKTNDFEVVKAALLESIKPTSIGEIEQFLSDVGGGLAVHGEEAEFTEETAGDEKPANTKASSGSPKSSKKPEPKKEEEGLEDVPVDADNVDAGIDDLQIEGLE